MENLRDLLLEAKTGNVTFASDRPDFVRILELVDEASEKGLLRHVKRTLSKRRGDLYDTCIAVTLKDGLSSFGDIWLHEQSSRA